MVNFMLSFAMNFVAMIIVMSATAASVGLLLCILPRTRVLGKKCMGGGFAACFVGTMLVSWIGNTQAHQLGFDDQHDRDEARAAHIDDPQKWHEARDKEREHRRVLAVAQMKKDQEDEQRRNAEAARAEQAAEVARQAQQNADDFRARVNARYVDSTTRSLRLLQASLKDPDSANIRDTQVHRLGDGRSSVCGYVNAKNSFGGYTGFKRFVVSADLGIVETEGLMQNVA